MSPYIPSWYFVDMLIVHLGGKDRAIRLKAICAGSEYPLFDCPHHVSSFFETETFGDHHLKLG